MEVALHRLPGRLIGGIRHRVLLARDRIGARRLPGERHFCIRCGWIGIDDESCTRCGFAVEPYRRDVSWTCEGCGESWNELRPRERRRPPRCPSCGGSESFPGLATMSWPQLRQRAARRGSSRCAAPGCDRYYRLELTRRRSGAGGGESNLDNLVYACSTHAWWYENRHRLLRDPRFWGRFVLALLKSVRERSGF